MTGVEIRKNPPPEMAPSMDGRVAAVAARCAKHQCDRGGLTINSQVFINCANKIERKGCDLGWCLTIDFDSDTKQ